MNTHNAAMSEWLRFSMRDLFICVTLVALGMIGLSSLRREFSLFGFLMWCVSGALIGIGCGI